MTTIRAVFFDAGDTLVHRWALKTERFGYLCRQAGIDLPADPALRQAGEVARERFFQDRRRHDDAWSPAWFARMNRVGLEAAGVMGYLQALLAHLYATEAALPDVQVVDPAAEPLLAALRTRGYRLAIVSNWDGTLVDQLRPAGLAGYFDAVLDSDVVGSRKPDTRIFELACACTGVAPAEAVMVGDSPDADVAGALAAGVRPVLLDALGAFADGFPGLPPFARIQHLHELPALLADWEA